MNEKARIKKEKDDYKDKMIWITNILESTYDKYIENKEYKENWYNVLGGLK